MIPDDLFAEERQHELDNSQPLNWMGTLLALMGSYAFWGAVCLCGYLIYRGLK